MSSHRKQRQRTKATPQRSIVKRFLFFLQHHTSGKRPVHVPRKKLIALFAAVCVGIAGIIYVLRDLPSPAKLGNMSEFAVSTKIFDRNGILLYEIFGDENRTPIKLDDLPPYVPQASIAIEDQNFYSHIGFDISGIARAIRNMLLKENLQGGSTITQQLVKTTLLTRERTLRRKMKEAILTVATEVMYSKDDILEMYLNHIPYGGTAWGIEAASQMYFDKHAKDLSIGEAALLAGLPQLPTRYSPFGPNPDLAKQRQHEVLRRMVEEKFITQQQADEAEKQELKYASSKINIQAPHFVFYVKEQLVDTYGIHMVERGGLRVYTTLDLSMQQNAQASLSAEIEKLQKYKVGNGAALVTKPNTGEILAMIGSRDYFDSTHDGQVNVTVRERLPGSSVKPLNVATGFQLKTLTPGTMLLDIPTCFLVTGQKAYCPKNYDGSFHGPVQTRFFLGNSYNIPEVKALAINGVDSLIATASAMGITTWTDPSRYGLSLTLGGGEVKMVDMVVAFGTLANQGVKVPTQSILRVEDFTGKILSSYDPEKTKKALDMMTNDQSIDELEGIKRILNREPAYLVSHILLDNSARSGAFGSHSELVIPNQVVSVKTGTTNDLKDNWTIGYTPEYLTAVWVGNNDSTPMNPYLVSGVTGAAPIWHDIMAYVLRDQKPIWPEKPRDIIDKQICVTSGLLPNPEAPCQSRNEFFWKGTEPTTMEQLRKNVWIVPETGLPLRQYADMKTNSGYQSGVPDGQSVDTSGLFLESHLVLSDPFTVDYCLDCSRPVDDKGRVSYERYYVDMQKFAINRIGKQIDDDTTE